MRRGAAPAAVRRGLGAVLQHALGAEEPLRRRVLALAAASEARCRPGWQAHERAFCHHLLRKFPAPGTLLAADLSAVYKRFKGAAWPRQLREKAKRDRREPSAAASVATAELVACHRLAWSEQPALFDNWMKTFG
jgi:hypothetical protein